MLRSTIFTRAFYGGVTVAVVLLLLSAPAYADLLAFFDFDDASNSDVAVDVSGNGNDGDIFDAEFTAPGGGRTGGASDRAMDFGDFNNDAFVEVTSAADGALDSITDNDTATITMWIYGNDQQPVDQWTWYIGQGGTRQLASHIPWSNANIYFDVAGCCNDDQRINMEEPNIELYSEEWNHYAFLKNEEYTAIYQNGELFHDSDAQGGPKLPVDIIDNFYIGSGPPNDIRSYAGLIDDFGVWDEALSEEQIQDIMMNGLGVGEPMLQPGDADQNLEFNQLDLVKVQIAAKYLTGAAATWGEGDWDGGPGGSVGSPPAGDGLFNQLDIIAALNANVYLTGPYVQAAIVPGGSAGDGQTSVVYNVTTGEVAVDAPAGMELTSINIDSAAAIFTGEPAQNLGGSFDNDADNNIFKATFGGSFGSLSFGNVAQTGLAEDFVANDLTVVGSLAGGGDLGDVDLIYVPEPSAVVLLGIGLLGLIGLARRSARR